MDMTALKAKTKEKMDQTVGFVRRHWKVTLWGFIGVAALAWSLSSIQSDEEINEDDDSLSYGGGGDMFGGKKHRATVEELREMSNLSDQLGDYDATIFTNMLTSFESGRMTMDDIRNKAKRSYEKVNYYNAPKCANGCGGYPDSCMGCNLGGNR
jgi:hypothetical protein